MVQSVFIIIGGSVAILVFGGKVGDTSAYENLRSAFVVLGGTFMSAALAYSRKNLKELIKGLGEAFSEIEVDHKAMVNRLTKLAFIYRKEGAQTLEAYSKKIEHSFLKKGLEMVVDGHDRFEIRNVMEQEFEIYQTQKDAQAGIVNTLAKLSPVFGFVGTILGLIEVLSHMGTPDQIGRGMALALLTTFYGLLFANFVFLPLSRKLTENNAAQAVSLNLIMEGVIGMAEERNSRAIRYRLESFLSMHDPDFRASSMSPAKAKNTKKPRLVQLLTRANRSKKQNA